ncbi:MAG: iron uptake transporter permease EfeU [Acetobacteraceae bacterium]
MLIAFLIMLREGLEAALIVGVIALYLHRTGRAAWIPAAWAGVALAVLICLGIGLVLNYSAAEFPQREQEAFEAVVAIVAVGILTSMVFWMRRASRSLTTHLHASIDVALTAGKGAGLALVTMVFLAVGREGLEALFFLLATVQQDVGLGVPIGAMLGLLAAVLIGWGIFAGGLRLDLPRFFRVTGVAIVFIAAGLCAAALRALHEAGIWNSLQQTAFDLSPFLPADGVIGTLLSGMLGYNDAPSVGEVLIYFGYLVPVLVLFVFPSRSAKSSTSAA